MTNLKTKIYLIKQIMTAAIEVSMTTKHDVFVEFSGHVNAIDVGVHCCGWLGGTVYNIFNCNSINELSIAQLKDCLAKINSLLN